MAYNDAYNFPKIYHMISVSNREIEGGREGLADDVRPTPLPPQKRRNLGHISHEHARSLEGHDSEPCFATSFAFRPSRERVRTIRIYGRRDRQCEKLLYRVQC